MRPYFPIRDGAAARAYEQTVLREQADVERAVMEAGEAIAAALDADFREWRPWPEAPRILVLAGKGLNAADAIVASAGLARRHPGLQVVVARSHPAAADHPLLTAALERLRGLLGERLKVLEAGESLPAMPVEVVIDGLYGLNFRPPLAEADRQRFKEVEALPWPPLRVAIDLPSGVGETVDPGAFVADFTYLVGVAKRPAFAAAARAHVGRLRFLPLEVFAGDDAMTPERFVHPRAYLTRNRLRPAQADKRQFGHGLIVAGSLSMPGAAAMATAACLEAGAGLVTTFAPKEVVTALAGSLPEAMWRLVPINNEGGVAVEAVPMAAELARRGGAMLIGPGLPVDRATRFTVSRLVREIHLPIVLDASALFPEILPAVMTRPASAGPVVLTPHAGEWERLTGGMDPGLSPEAALKAFSLKYRVTVLLKGVPSLVASEGALYFLPAGGPVLARGGSGDILAGMLLALLAQDARHPLEAVCAAVTWHGAAADSLAREKGQVAVRTTALLSHLSTVLRAVPCHKANT
jgi:hydroxyethylthiazole kinase-like uncharacterized protein yjeF